MQNFNNSTKMKYQHIEYINNIRVIAYNYSRKMQMLKKIHEKVYKKVKLVLNMTQKT